MAKTTTHLTDAAVRGFKAPGRYPDGSALWLQVTRAVDGASVRKSWIVRVRPPYLGPEGKISRRPRDLGLGTWPSVSLSDARQKAQEAREIAKTRDPLEARSEAVKASLQAQRDAEAVAARAKTFKQAADEYVRAHQAAWRSDKHAAQIKGHLANWTLPIIGALPVGSITTDDVLRCLEQPVDEKTLWLAKPETASRVRLRIESILDWAAARGLRSGDNPARWRGHLNKLLPQPGKVRKPTPYAALPYNELPDFMAKLRQEAGVAPRALELAIICGSRANEVLNARVEEFDLDKAEWRIPAGRMKAGREHKIPLTPRAVEIVRAALKAPGQVYVFTGAKAGRPLSNMAMLQTLRRMGVAVTQHGFRAAFATWAGEQTAFPREVILRAIAHVVGSASDQSYERGDQFQRRRDLMLTWQSHLDGKAGADVLPFPKAGAQ